MNRRQTKGKIQKRKTIENEEVVEIKIFDESRLKLFFFSVALKQTLFAFYAFYGLISIETNEIWEQNTIGQE